MQQRAAPKFTSFRPLQSPLAKAHKRHLPLQSYACSQQSFPLDARAVVECLDKPRSQCYGRRRHDQRKLSTSHNFLEEVAEKQATNRTDFAIDTVGDPGNLTFGALHQYSTPSYLRAGAGLVIGSRKFEKIDPAASSAEGLVLLDHDNNTSRIWDRRQAWKNIGKGSHEIRIRSKASDGLDLDVAADYISLRRKLERRGSSDQSSTGSFSSSNGKDTHYRSLQGRAKMNDQPKDHDLIDKYDRHSFGDEENDLSLLNISTRKTRANLLEKTQADPTNPVVWLALIRDQDEMFGSLLTDVQRRSNAEIKVAMYDQALAKVTDPEGRETLLLGKMQEASLIWHNRRLWAYWRKSLQDYPGYMRLWMKYLDVKQADFVSFSYEDVRRTYMDCLSMLHKARCTAHNIEIEQEHLYETQIYVLLRMALFMRECGYAEHGTAGWQALLEYEFCRPGHSENHEHIPMSSFEDFWDSEVPRIGENGSEGWARFCEKPGKCPRSFTDVTETSHKGERDWPSWVASERSYSTLCRIPARTIDKTPEDDPYRVILFPDIRPFLVRSPSAKSQSACLDAFLAFVHLPPYREKVPSHQRSPLPTDAFVRDDVLYKASRVFQLSGLRGTDQSENKVSECPDAQENRLERDSSRASPFSFPLSEYLLSFDSLFAVEGSWFSTFEVWKREYLDDHGPVNVALVYKSLKYLVFAGVGGDSLAIYFLALELIMSPETVKRTAKNILRERPISLALYNAYALIEYRLGNTVKAESVMITSINMAKGLNEAAQMDRILLWRTWIWELLGAGRPREAFRQMLTYGDAEIENLSSQRDWTDYLNNPTPSSVLRVESALTSTRDYLLSLRFPRHAVYAMECLVLLHYFQTSFSVAAASSIFHTNLNLLSTYSPPKSLVHEYFHQSFARLLYQHTILNRLYQPSDIRSFLAECITKFSQNTIFLSLYAWNESRFRLDDRVRAVVKDLVFARSYDLDKTQSSINSHFSAIHSELTRNLTFGSNTSTIRAAFEHAVQSASGIHCAGFWKLYFLFETFKDLDRAKMVLSRGIQACPWVKDLYLMWFEYARDVSNEADLRGVYELMVEKEIRVHIVLENTVKGIDK